MKPSRAYLWLAGILLLMVTARVVPMALAGHHLLHSPALALQFRSDHPEALASQAEFAAAGAEWRTAERLAKASLAADPFNGRAFRVLAQATENVASPERTLRLMQIALARSPLDFAARYWLIERAEMRGAPLDAVPLYERLLRLDPAGGIEVYPALAQQLSLLVRSGLHVSGWFQGAPWRTEFLAQRAQQESDDAAVDALFREAQMAGGLSSPEQSAWMDRYVRKADWPAAAARWRELTGRDVETRYGLSGGDFEHESGPPPFGWAISSPPGVDVTVDMSGSSHLLRVDFLGQRSPFSHVAQLVLLPEGSYALTWRSRGEGFRGARGLQWTVRCAATADAPLLASRHFPHREDDRWQVQREAFAVPPGCPAQWVRLSLDARIAAETEAYGTVLLDDISIVAAAPMPTRS